MKKYITVILVVSLLSQLFGCYSIQSISIEELKESSNKNNITVFVKDSISYDLSRDYTIKNDSISGKGWMNNWERTEKNKLFKGKIAISDIELIQGDKFNLMNTFFLLIGIVGVVVIIAGLTFSLPNGSLLGSGSF